MYFLIFVTQATATTAKANQAKQQTVLIKSKLQIPSSKQ